MIHIKIVILAVALCLAVVSISCSKQTDTDIAEDQRVLQLEELAQKRQAREGELAEMNVVELLNELQRESEERVEPFNSMSYRELVSRGEQAASEVKTSLAEATRVSFLGLLALRQLSTGAYGELESSFRVAVLIDALRTSEYFNAWGLPHLYWEDAASAIIAEGEVAREPLTALLRDRRPAPSWGSEEALESSKYGYRVRDYAWALLNAIDARKIEIPVDPTQRDDMISSEGAEGPG